MNLADKAVAGFQRADSNFESSALGKTLLNSVTNQREIISERKSESMLQTIKFLF